MSRNSKQRRDARKKKAGAGRGAARGGTGSRSTTHRFDQDPFAPSDGAPHHDGFEPHEAENAGHASWAEQASNDDPGAVADLFRIALDAGSGLRRDAWRFDRTVDRLEALTPRLPNGYFDDLVGSAAIRQVSLLFDNGWQPAELVHVVARKSDAAGARLLMICIGVHTAEHRAFTTAPQSWIDQLTDLDVPQNSSRGRPAAIRGWRETERISLAAAWRPAFLMICAIGGLGRLPVIGPLPCDWGSHGTTSTGARRKDSKILGRIRGLLAKAESSEFAEEAEALTAKAQHLMTRHAIETALLDADENVHLTEQVEQRRVLIASPYPEAKESLLNCVAATNAVKAISHGDLGLMSIVGMPVDLDLVELLYTSLLVQATNAVREAGRNAGQRTPSFRRSFLLSYAQRIRERLETARDEATADLSAQYGRELVPVLDPRAEAVGAVFAETFPESYAKSAPAVSNRAGWAAGRTAADFADLTGGRTRLQERSA